jgi:hypothetical protein
MELIFDVFVVLNMVAVWIIGVGPVALIVWHLAGD